MRFDKFKKRLSSLEVRSGLQDAQLHLRMEVRAWCTVRDPLGCMIATWNKIQREHDGPAGARKPARQYGRAFQPRNQRRRRMINSCSCSTKKPRSSPPLSLR